MTSRDPADDDSRPFFFLSYARSRFRPDDGSDPDRWVAKFYKDLCGDLASITGSANPGFMDRQIPAGAGWPDHSVTALARCRVFVALMSPAYFHSEFCGREWAAFAQRWAEGEPVAARDSAIIPVLWTPMAAEEFPEHVRALQYLPATLPAAYGNLGIYGIMKLARYRDQYRETILELAKAIKQTAAVTDLPAAESWADLMTLDNAFVRHEPSAADLARRIRAMAASEPRPELGHVRTKLVERLGELRDDPEARAGIERRSHELSILLGSQSTEAYD